MDRYDLELQVIREINAASAGGAPARLDRPTLSLPLLMTRQINNQHEGDVLTPETPHGYEEHVDILVDDMVRQQSLRKLARICTHFEEAAIYLNEGIENEKFAYHPSSQYSYHGYNIVHHPVYYFFIPFVDLLLLLLTIVEQPTFVDIPLKVTPAIQLFLLAILTVDVVMKVLWLSPKNYVRRRLYIFKCIVLFLSVVEAIVIIARNSQDFHITRILRPIFLLDTQIMTDVKRVLHQIQKVLGPIIDILCFIFFAISLIGSSGYYLFGSTSALYRFRTLAESMVNLFITVTQELYPSPLLDRYHTSDYSPIYAVIFVLWCTLVLSKLLLAVVNSSFVAIQRNKFKSLYLHRRDALRRAFDLLQTNGSISFSGYIQMMRWYAPKVSVWKILCSYKAMTQARGSLNLEEFYSFYDIQKLNWRQVDENGEVMRWYSRLSASTANKFHLLTRIVTHQLFKITMNIIVFINVIYFYELTSHIGRKVNPDNRLDRPQELIGVNLTFVIIYMIEAMIKITALGPRYYFYSYWNTFDFLVTNFSFIVDILQMFYPELVFLVPIRFIRLIRFNERFRTITNTIAQLLPRIFSVFILFLILYYFFAVIGMESFSGKIYRGCCNSSSIGRHFTGDPLPNDNDVYFYVLSFDSLPQSYVMLFEVMVGSNWWIVMEGVTTAQGSRHTRAYFLAFMISTTVLFTVSLSFILQAFVFQVQLDSLNPFKSKPEEAGATSMVDEGKLLEVYHVTLSKEELIDMENEMSPFTLPRKSNSAAMPDMLLFQGKRRKTKADLLQLVYHDYITKWKEEDSSQVLLQTQRLHCSTANRSQISNAKRMLISVGTRILEIFKAILVYVFV